MWYQGVFVHLRLVIFPPTEDSDLLRLVVKSGYSRKASERSSPLADVDSVFVLPEAVLTHM
jgi:hypothetical protein